MDQRNFGNSSLKVSALGFGAGLIGDEDLSEKAVKYLLDAALDAGITLIDTARGYGLSEERIGRLISHRRQSFVLSTKVGYSIPGYQDWTYDCIIAGVDTALKQLNTDHIDMVHLHSCPLETLQADAVVRALEDAQKAGKFTLCGYAGDNDPIDFAIQSDRFQSLITSANICDQQFINRQLHPAKTKGIGIIAKRPVANAPWRFKDRPVGHYCEPYWERLQKMNLDFDLPWQEVALRFSAYTYGIDSAIVGTTNPKHLLENVKIIEKGKLPEELIQQITGAFQRHDDGWDGQI